MRGNVTDRLDSQVGRKEPTAALCWNRSRRFLYMPRMLRSLIAVAGAGLLSSLSVSQGQNAFSPGGNDYPIAGSLVGDQTAPQAAIKPTGGYVVWQENGVDGDGLGIRAQRVDGNFNRLLPQFRVNSITALDQEKPQLAALTNGGAVFVWQGGRQGFQDIYARFLPASGTTFSTTDILVNTFTNSFQINPSVATLKDGGVVVVWASDGQDGSMQGIYGQRLSATGAKLGAEFQVHLYPLNNQRTPSVAALSGGGFVVTWVSELQRNPSSVDVYARIFNASGVAVGGEFPVNADATRICANPSVAGSPDGGFAVAWSQRDGTTSNQQYVPENGLNTTTTGSTTTRNWDVYARVFQATGVAAGSAVRLNTFEYGDQYAPKLSTFGSSYLAVWTGLGQDGSMEGVFGQFFSSSAQLAGQEFRVNTDAGNRQIGPTVCTDGVNHFLVVWSSFATSGNFDLFARSYNLITVDIIPIAGGVRISWNTRPAGIYQVQSSTNYTTWNNHGSPRTASGYSDSVDVPGSGGATVYRVVRVY